MAIALNIKYESDGKLHYTNSSGSTLPVRSIVVIGNRVGVLAQALEDGETGIAYISGVWPMPVATALTPAAGDVYGFDVLDEEFNDDLVNNLATAVVTVDVNGNLCPVADVEWLLIG